MERYNTPSYVHLFSRPSFLKGVASIVDPFGTLSQYNRSINERVADFRALRSDWLAVGRDFLDVIEQHRHLLHEE